MLLAKVGRSVEVARGHDQVERAAEVGQFTHDDGAGGEGILVVLLIVVRSQL